ncbi:ETC complex I subunit conserved region-domain-containing protein [Polychytrium aggregatum]|uniref:ETC complex I subunit conserved region-domain-containing protein n=1 Tax=Polychytrium aggregatum TaxID=110093 RepID=UPI0022FE16B0|nr:ETC complex I subunit conserved region-domain-containing protein [Polychytrium aggregatum]KAI9205757.1 ETC complex I subunit conserved region-domain-containing protein [Polychytrium aggregatum]
MSAMLYKRVAAVAAPSVSRSLLARSMSGNTKVIPSAESTTGSEIFEVDALNGCPPEISRRSVRIYAPAKTAMQSGTNKTNNWRIDFDTLDRWENPLMGWQSSADPCQGLATLNNFRSKEDAIRFAERHGYDYWIDEPKQAHFRIKSYAENYKYVPGKLRIAKTK